MRVIFVVHQFFPDYKAGTEVLTLSCATEMLALGHDVSVFTFVPVQRSDPRAGTHELGTYSGIPVHRRFCPDEGWLYRVGMDSDEYDNRVMAQLFRTILMEMTPDVIHFFHLYRASASLVEVGSSLNIPMFFTPTDFWVLCPRIQLMLPNGKFCEGPNEGATNCIRHAGQSIKPRLVGDLIGAIPHELIGLVAEKVRRSDKSNNRFARAVKMVQSRSGFIKECYARFARVYAPTRLMRSLLCSNGFDVSKTDLLQYGIEMSGCRRRIRGEHSVEVLRVGFIGSMVPHKGAHVLLDALEALTSMRINVKLYGAVTAGNRYAEALLEQSRDLPSVTFEGEFRLEDIWQVLDELDVLVVPSTWRENAPLVVYSAQAAGCAVVASRVAGIEELVTDGVDGMLFTPGDSGELASALKTLLSPGTLCRLTSNAPAPQSVQSYVSVLISDYGAHIRTRDSH